jgi:hypothetical protein
VELCGENLVGERWSQWEGGMQLLKVGTCSPAVPPLPHRPTGTCGPHVSDPRQSAVWQANIASEGG